MDEYQYPDINVNNTAPKFYLIGTKYGRAEDVLPRMIRDGVISTGFAKELDLSPIVGKKYSEALRWLESRIPQQSGLGKNTLARFATIKPGDLVALKAHSAPRGTQPRLVLARFAVVAGNRGAMYARSDSLGHTLKVDFLDEQEPFELPLGYGQTLHVIEDQERINLIFGRYARAASEAAKESPSIQNKAEHRSEVAARGAYLMRRTHNKIQNELRKLLVAKYGEAAVKQEEKFVDLIVRTGEKTVLIEVKSSPSPIACIREALGQLLQYSWNLRLHGGSVCYVIVGPSIANAEQRRFIQHICRETNLTLTYCSPETFEVG